MSLQFVFKYQYFYTKSEFENSLLRGLILCFLHLLNEEELWLRLYNMPAQST